MKDKAAGRGLHQLRVACGLTLKAVEAQSRTLAETRSNKEYVVTAGRLSQVENSSSLPSIFKLASLSEIYRTPYPDLLRLYGIEAAGTGRLAAAGRLAEGDEEGLVALSSHLRH